MLSVYLASLVFGGIFVVASVLFGDHDKDFDKDFDLDLDADVDIDADVDADVDVDHDLEMDHGDSPGSDMLHLGGEAAHDALWLPFFSLRFWTFALASFGMTGTLLHLLIGTMAIVFPTSLAAGVSIGTFAAWTFKRLKTETVSADTGLQQYVGAEARVLIPVTATRPGKIVIDSLAGQIELRATTKDDKPLERGQRVLVAYIDGADADVTSLPRGGTASPERNKSTA